MMFQSPGDIAFNIFGFPIYFYGIILAIAIVVGVYTAYFLYKKYYDAQNAQCIFDISPYAIIFGIIGARLYYCIVNYHYYAVHPLEIFDIRQGGLSIHGMIIAGVITLIIMSKRCKIPALKLLDCFLCSTALAQSIGRWGNFFNSEAFGLPTDLPWKLFIPLSKRPEQFASSEYFHPTFLYEGILDLLIFFVLLALFRRFHKKPGLITCFYLILYSLARISVESLRIDSVLSIQGFPVAQVASIALIIIALGLLPVFYFKNAG